MLLDATCCDVHGLMLVATFMLRDTFKFRGVTLLLHGATFLMRSRRTCAELFCFFEPKHSHPMRRFVLTSYMRRFHILGGGNLGNLGKDPEEPSGRELGERIALRSSRKSKLEPSEAIDHYSYVVTADSSLRSYGRLVGLFSFLQ